MQRIETLEQLTEIYGSPGKSSLVKEVDHVTPHYRAFIEASPFCTMATIGDGGMDCTPRGDLPGFVHIMDKKTLAMPDRHGNNRVDSLSNIIQDPRIALCFLVPGSQNCLRINGTAHISIDPELKASFEIDGKQPRSVVVIHIRSVYFQCGRAILRSNLWQPESWNDHHSLPTPGEILAELSDNNVGGNAYDSGWKERANKTLW